MEKLQRERVGVGGPIVAMVLGYSTALVAGVVGLTAHDSARRVKQGGYGNYDPDLDFNDDGDVDHGDHKNWVKTARVGAGLSGAGFLIGILGTANLHKANEQRENNQKTLASLRAERTNLLRQLEYGPDVAPNQLGLSMRGRF
jgi:hypothetical protein